MIIAVHSIRIISPQRDASSHSFDFINLVNTLNEKSIANNNTTTDITVNMYASISIITPPLLCGNSQHSYTEEILRNQF